MPLNLHHKQMSRNRIKYLKRDLTGSVQDALIEEKVTSVTVATRSLQSNFMKLFHALFKQKLFWKKKKKTLTCLNDHVNHAAGHGICLTIHPLKWEAATNSHTKLSSVHINCCILFRGISTVTASLQNGHQYLCMLSDVDLLEISDWGLNKNKVKTTLTQTGMLPKFHTVAFPV